MKNIRNWMLFAMVLLFFDVHIGIINLLPNWLSYIILAYCAKKIMEDKGGLTAAIGIISAVLQIVYFFFETDNALFSWLFSGIFWTMEMLLFYGLATVSYTHLDVYKRQGKLCVCRTEKTWL